MLTQSFDPLEINSPVESSATNSIASGGYLVSPVGNGNEKDGRNNKHNQVPDSTDVGWLKFRPNFLNHFMNARWMLFWLCWGSTLQGLLVNGFINVVITSIERRFGLRSSQTGLIASAYDIASFLCLAPVTFFGGRKSASKPRWIAWGTVIMGLGSFVFALPHFLVGSYRASGSDDHICSVGNNTLQGCSPDNLTTANNENENLSWNVWVFFFAQILNGVGASPLFTLGVTYIDENVSKKMSSVYLGIYYTVAILGPAVGFVMGGQFLQIYTDFISVDPNTLGLTPQSKVWVGAWWIPFIFTGVLCILLAIPMAAYPSSLPGAENIKKESEAHGNTAENQIFTKFKEMPKAFCSLMKNPTFFFLNLAGASEGMIIAGFSAFLPKLIENQYSVNAVWAALLMGVVTVPAGGGGTYLGGYLVKRYNLTCSGIIKLCLAATTVATIFTLCFLLPCPNLNFAGVTAPYFPISLNSSTIPTKYLHPEHISFHSNPFALEHTCNMKCTCSRSYYDPICGKDGVMYYSPCHAGCSREVSLDKIKVFEDCSCINSKFNWTIPDLDDKFEAANIVCDSDCNNLWKFLVFCFFVMFFTFLASMPSLSATLRCVQESQRSFALGIQWIKVRILGTIPAPMVFGFLIDASCILWQESCDDQGACLVYDNKYMSRYMLAIALIGKACSIMFFFGAWWFYIPPKGSSTTPQQNETVSVTTVGNGHVNLSQDIKEKY